MRPRPRLATALASAGARGSQAPDAATRVSRLDTPFLPLGQAVRFLFLYYLFAYRIVFPLMVALMSDGPKDLLGLRVMAELYYTCLLAFPFIFYRREYGCLHPLVLPTVYDLAKAVGKDPTRLILPFNSPLVDYTVPTQSSAAVLSLPNIDLAWLRLEYSLIMSLSLTAYVAFFLFGPTFRVPRFRLYKPKGINVTAGAFIGALVGIASVFVVMRGGISELLVAFRGGRREVFGDSGYLVFAGQVAPLIALIWFGYQKRPWASPAFLLGLGAALFTALIVTGARSSLIMPVLWLVLLWWRQTGRVLLLPTLGVAVLALIVVGGFGSIRQDYSSKVVDTSVFEFDQLGATMGLALTDIAQRDSAEPGLAVVAGVHQKGLLMGRSYLNTTTFWVPRGVWPDKPVGIDFYNMWINFRGNPIDSRPPKDDAWGIPVGAVMESYWNFGVLGVIIIFGIVGTIQATLAKAAHVYRYVPAFWVFYIYTLVLLDGSSKGAIEFMRYMIVFFAFLIFSGIIRLSGRPGGAERLPGLSAA